MNRSTLSVSGTALDRKKSSTPLKHKPTNRSQRLSFLRPQNFLSPGHPHQLPLTAYQVKDLLKWSGASPKETAMHLGVSVQSMRLWAKTSTAMEVNKKIPTTIWHYWAIQLGLIDAPQLRRVEPNTSITESYFNQNSESPLNLRATINYQRQLVTVYVEYQQEPIIEIPVAFEADVQNKTLTISGKYRNDDCPWYFDTDREDPTIKSLEEFMREKVWPACWRLHDFYSLQPEMFLKPEHLLPLGHKDFKVPDSKTLYRFFRWLGATAGDVADTVWETPDYMRFLVSPAAEAEYAAAAEANKLSSSDSDEVKQAKKRALFIARMKTSISAQGWHILTSSVGLSSPINVLGQKDPRKRHEKTFSFKMVSEVPVEFLKIKSIVDWADHNEDRIAVTYSLSTHEKRGQEQTVWFEVENTNGVVEIDGAMAEDPAPKAWQKAFDLSSVNIPESDLKSVKDWFELALWRYTWKVVNHRKFN